MLFLIVVMFSLLLSPSDWLRRHTPVKCSVCNKRLSCHWHTARQWHCILHWRLS